MGVGIASGVLDALIAEAAGSPDAEICGLLFGSRDAIASAEPCANVARDPARTFEIDPAALFAAYRRARDGAPAVIGCYHSHPSGSAVPSSRDAEAAMGDDALWLILAGGEARLWRTVEPGAFVEEAIDVAGAPR